MDPSPLVDRQLTPEAASAAEAAAAGWPRLQLDAWMLSDLELLGNGGFSPLEGFMGEADHARVCAEMRLADGRLWPLPVTLAADEPEARAAEADGRALLIGPDGTAQGEIVVEGLYRPDRAAEARACYGTDDPSHPGVRALLARPAWNVAGRVRSYGRAPRPFPALALSPAQVRATRDARGWKTMVGFQTRNPIHRAHEYIQKCALEIVDGLLLHPLVGETKDDDVPAAVRVRSYERLLAAYYPSDRVLLAAFPAAMRYAGPREAVFHALVRRKYGCTHFVVGRDHAGVGSWYGPFDAQALVASLADELGVVPLCFDASFFCRDCGGVATAKTCPHPPAARIAPSGTKVREMLRAGHAPPPEVTRPEVAAVLVAAMREPEAAAPSAPEPAPVEPARGRTIWLTGLSAAGKTTIAHALASAMRARGRHVDVLDGDDVRRGLTADLGFSKADRIENNRRIGYVAGVLNRNGIDAIVAAIAPYAEGRAAARAFAPEFHEIFVSCPIDVCAARDPKGLYRKAFAGEIKGFTGVDDPYEPPERPDLELRTDLDDVQTCVDRLLALIGV